MGTEMRDPDVWQRVDQGEVDEAPGNFGVEKR
jgi:hypothetical protein